MKRPDKHDKIVFYTWRSTEGDIPSSELAGPVNWYRAGTPYNTTKSNLSAKGKFGKDRGRCF